MGGVTAVREMPYGRVFNSWNFTLDDRPEPPPGNPWWANARGVDHGYFSTLGIAVREGRVFDAADLRGPPQVAVINEAFARKYWPDGQAAGPPHPGLRADVRIVGVVADTRGTCDQAGCAGGGAGRLDRAPEPEVYLPNCRASAWATSPCGPSGRSPARSDRSGARGRAGARAPPPC